MLQLMSWNLCQKPIKVTSKFTLRWTILVNGLKRMHSQIRKHYLSLMSLSPSCFVGFVSLVNCTLTKAEISNPSFSRKYASPRIPNRPGRIPYIHSPKALLGATTGLQKSNSPHLSTITTKFTPAMLMFARELRVHQPRSQGFSLLRGTVGKRPWHRVVTS